MPQPRKPTGPDDEPPTKPKPPTGPAQPPTGGSQPPPGGAKPPTGPAQPPTGGSQPPPGGAKPPTGPAQPPADGSQPAPSVAKPPAGGGELRAEPADDSAVEVRQELAVTRERLDATVRERDEIKSTLTSVQLRLEESTSALADAQRDLGRLQEITKQRDAVLAERDSLGEQLRQVQSATDSRVESAVRAALDKADATSKDAISSLQVERDALAKRVTELDGLTSTPRTNRVTPTVLAQRFAEVLQRVSTEQPPDQPVAALTSLDIEAKGILEAPPSGGDEPVLRTVEGTVDAGQLSTVRMSFRLLPPSAAPPKQ